MAAAIVLTGLGSNDPVPGNYIEVNFAQGPAAGSSIDYPVLLLGNKTSSGSATVDTVIYGPESTVPMQTESDVIALFGPGSEIHRMWRRFTAVNQTTRVYALAVAESSGTAASGTVTIATNAAASGNLRYWVCDEFVDVPIASGDTPTVIAAALKAAINAKTHWPVTADNTAGVLTVTAKLKGPRGNEIMHQAVIQSSGAIGTTVSPTADTAFTSGATADSNVTALTTLLAKRFYYIVSAANDTTQVGALCTQVDTQAQPLTGIRQRVFAGVTSSTEGTANDLPAALNNARAEVQWQMASDWTGPDLAANAAAVFSLFEAERKPLPRHNFSGFGLDTETSPYWKVPSPRSGSMPTRANLLAALNDGLSPIASTSNGKTYLVKRVTTKTTTNSQPDYRIRDAHKVTVCDFFADDVVALNAQNFSGKDLADDPAQGQPEPGKNVVTPKVYKSALFNLVNVHAANEQLQNAEQIKAGIVVQREAAPRSRLSARIPLQPVDILDQFAVAIDQVA